MKIRMLMTVAALTTNAACAVDGEDVAHDYVAEHTDELQAYPCMDECEVQECCHICYETFGESAAEYEPCCGICGDMACRDIKAMPTSEPVGPTPSPAGGPQPLNP